LAGPEGESSIMADRQSVDVDVLNHHSALQTGSLTHLAGFIQLFMVKFICTLCNVLSLYTVS